MPIALSPEVKQLIDRPNFAHLATLMPDGSPQSVPVWVGREVEHIVICTGGARLRGRTRGATGAVDRRLHKSLRGSSDSRPRR
jgi:Pyridoxamine 5'-phosphate oxidase